MLILGGIFCLHLSLNLRWKGPSCKESWKSPWDIVAPKKLRKLTSIICMGIFLARNTEIFQERPQTLGKVGAKVIFANDSIPHDVVNPKLGISLLKKQTTLSLGDILMGRLWRWCYIIFYREPFL